MGRVGDLKLFQKMDWDEEFFALFFSIDEVVDEGSLLIQVIEEIFLSFYLEDSIIIRQA